MLHYQTAQELYERLTRRIAEEHDPDIRELYADLLTAAVDYTDIRARFFLMSPAQQAERDGGRTICHDSFISYLSAVCRVLQIEDMEVILPDRKTKGDFACYLTLFLGLESR